MTCIPLNCNEKLSAFLYETRFDFLGSPVHMAPQQERNSEASAHENVEVSAPKTRQDRMAQHNEKCERIIHYLRSGKHQDGLSKNQQRVVCSQAKNYVFDDTRS